MASKNKALRETVEKSTTADRISMTHGAYLIVAGRWKEECTAVAYLGKKKVDAISAETTDAAVEAMKAALDTRVSDLKAERVGDVPTVAEFREALGALYPELPGRITAILTTHCQLPGATASVADLARRFGIAETTIKLHYGKLAKKLAAVLNFAPPGGELERKLVPFLSLALVESSKGDQLVLRLRPELVTALRGMHQPHASA